MGEHGWFDKRFMYEESMHMPLVMRYPGVIKPGTTINDMVVNIDFTPTFEAIAGAKIPADVQGKSFLPLLKGDNKNWRKSTYYHYYEFPAEHSVMKHFGIRTSKYKLIRFYTGKDFWELYDLQTDPHEMKNLYGEKQYESLTIQLKNELRGLIKEYKDEEAMKIMDTGL
jgi:arylsulfatase A-like enzyme